MGDLVGVWMVAHPGWCGCSFRRDSPPCEGYILLQRDNGSPVQAFTNSVPDQHPTGNVPAVSDETPIQIYGFRLYARTISELNINEMQNAITSCYPNAFCQWVKLKCWIPSHAYKSLYKWKKRFERSWAFGRGRASNQLPTAVLSKENIPYAHT